MLRSVFMLFACVVLFVGCDAEKAPDTPATAKAPAPAAEKAAPPAMAEMKAPPEMKASDTNTSLQGTQSVQGKAQDPTPS
jgi:hypothetical protein